MKQRLLDIAVATTVIVFTAPLMALLAVAVKLDSPGPVVYAASRMGRGGSRFTLYKFRSMRSDDSGPGITVGGDSRVTRVGRVLRATKLDELPQMWNVLKGDMSVVGPRPEDPRYAEWYPDDLAPIFQFKPGITSPASVTFRDEEGRLAELTAEGATLEDAYRTVLREKIPIDLAYFPTRTLRTDLQWIWRTAVAMVPNR